MAIELRRFTRKNIILEAELIVDNKSYVVFIVNLSLKGLYITTAPLKNPIEIIAGTKLELNTQLPAGDIVHLPCKVIWLLKV